MKNTNKRVQEFIRVDHAGERGAIKIYEGQLLALKTIKENQSLKEKIEEMWEQEQEHLNYFEKEIQKRNIKPTQLLPLWDIMGVALGFGTTLIGAISFLVLAMAASVLSYKFQSSSSCDVLLSPL